MSSRANREFHELVATTPLECTETNPSYFFADERDEEEEFGRSERAIALSICKRCPIINACFQYAVENNISEGVWGGAVPQQREEYRRKVSTGPNPLLFVGAK